MVALLVSLAALAWLVPVSASAAEFVSISGSKVNIRAQPTTRSKVLWELSRGYPLQVQQRKGKWLKVRDFEETLGWVFASLVDKTPHRVVTAPIANLRSGPSTKRKILGKLQRYDVVRSLGQSGSWAHVRKPGGKTGWVAKRLTWGW